MKEFRFVIGVLGSFKKYIDDLSFIDGYDMSFAGVPSCKKTTYELVENSEYRDYQIPVRDFVLTPIEFDYLTQDLSLCQLALVKLKTALMTAALIGNKIGVVVLAKYVDKWVADIQETFKIDPKRILVVVGAKYLKGLLFLASQDKLGKL